MFTQQTAQYKTKLNYSCVCVIRDVCPVTSLAISHHSIVSLLLDGMRLNLHVILSLKPNSQILESQTRCVQIENIVTSTQIDVTAGEIRLGTQFKEPSVHASERSGCARQVPLGVRDLLEPLHNLGPLHDFGAGQLQSLASVLLRVHAVGADGGSHIASPHGLLQVDTTVDVD